MSKGFAHLEVEGLKEFQADLKRQQGKLPDVLGQIHKELGQFIIGKLPEGNPYAVGAGTGAAVRPSATKRDVVLRAGYGAREAIIGSRGGVLPQWGKTVVQPFESGRPYIVGAIEENEEAIYQKFIDRYTEALAPAFYKAE